MKYSYFPNQFISHPFFPQGAVLYNLKNTMVFVYVNEDHNPDGKMLAWYTGAELCEGKLNSFLDECADGKHDTLGSGQAGTFAEVMKDLNEAFNAN